MASPADLVEELSRLTGLPHATVVDIDRRLVIGGLRAKAGRGRNAARMTPLDAARLLTAILASPQANTSVEAVERYTQTVVDRTRSTDRLYEATGHAELTKLPARHDFVAALEALITAMMDARRTATHPDHAPQIEVFAFTRATQGRVRLSGLANSLTVSVEYRPAEAGRRGRAEASAGDLEQSRRITGRTILGLAQLLAGEHDDD